MIIIEKETGREFELLHVHQAEATHHIYGAGIAEGTISGRAGWPLRLVRKRHEFGGVVWEEGEHRSIKHKEAFVWDDGDTDVWHSDSASENSYIVLHPVEILHGEASHE